MFLVTGRNVNAPAVSLRPDECSSSLDEAVSLDSTEKWEFALPDYAALRSDSSLSIYRSIAKGRYLAV